jgi:hypothetical protein
MPESLLQPEFLTVVGEVAPGQLYVTVPQLIAVALLAGGVVMLTWAFRRGSGGPAKPGDKAKNTPPEPVASYMADARELADLLGDRLDRQAHRLERLIAQADEKIRRLERRQSEAEPGPGIHPRHDSDPLNQQVYDLADSGLPAVEIARTLQQHTGKVELILALRGR